MTCAFVAYNVPCPIWVPQMCLQYLPCKSTQDSPSITGNIDFDASDHHPFEEEQEQQVQEEGGTSMAVAKPEECVGVIPLPPVKQKAVDYVKASYNYFSSLRTEMQALARSFIFK